MSQSTLDDDEELFGEAAEEMREDVERDIAAAWDALPDPEEIWESDADNVLGVLNGLKTALDADEAEQCYRDAMKWYTMGTRADAFEDAEDLESELETLETVVEDVRAAREQVGDLAGTVPELRSALQDSHTDGNDGGDADGTEDAESEESGTE
jgi:hypothetical protein